jgi:hypothetical protein
MKKRVKNIINVSLQKLSGRARSASVSFALLAMWTTTGAYQGLAQQPDQPTFQSAPEATQSLFQAVQSNNEQAIATILGGQTELTSSRDPAQDKVDRELFVQKYQEMHRLGREPDGSVTLYIGAENWPFPIPIIEKNKAWRFDADAGTKGVLYRRIGENELSAVAACRQFTAQEKEHRANPNAANRMDSTVLFHGYYFRKLPTGQTTGAGPGFAILAYPAEYRSSGVMTFVITSNNVVYEKDLGADTPALGSAMAAFHRDGTWHAVNE